MNYIIFFFFFNDTATTEIYTLSLHDALPISARPIPAAPMRFARSACSPPGVRRRDRHRLDRFRADLGAPPGRWRAAALFPRSRHRGGGVPERLPARAEKLAAKRS